MRIIHKIHLNVSRTIDYKKLNILSNGYNMTTQKTDLPHKKGLAFDKPSSEPSKANIVKNSVNDAHVFGSSIIKHHYFSFIQKLDVLQNIPEQLRDELIRTATIKHCPRFNLLFQEGEKPDHLYIVLDGCVKLFKGNAGGDEAILKLMTKGDMFLASSVFLNATYPVNAQVTKNADILSFPASSIRNGIKTHSRFALNILNDISQNSQSIIQHAQKVRLKSATERVGWFLLKLLVQQGMSSGMIELPYDKTSIAAYLDMKPETLSRALKKFKKYDFNIKNNSIAIPSSNSLCGFCDTDIGLLCNRHGTPDCPNPDCIPEELSKL